MRRYVQDLPDEVICEGTKLVPVLERREFAVPVPSDRASGTVTGKPGRRVRDVTTLDPADPVDRQLITVNDLSARMISQHSFSKRPSWRYKNCPPGICKRCYHSHVWAERPRRNREVAVLELEPFEPEPWQDPDGLPF
jgi:hypothetical protein